MLIDHTDCHKVKLAKKQVIKWIISGLRLNTYYRQTVKYGLLNYFKIQEYEYLFYGVFF